MYKEICVLAMSNTFNEICIAGVDSNGEWIRPIKNGGRFWCEEDLMFENKMLEIGNTVCFNGEYFNDGSSSVHTEDFSTTEITLVDIQDLIFNRNYDSVAIAHSDVSLLCEETLGKSLALISLEEIQVFKNSYEKVRCSLLIPELGNIRTAGKDYAFNDYYHKPKVSGFPKIVSTRYVSIGLAKPFRRGDEEEEICHPQIVGVIL